MFAELSAPQAFALGYKFERIMLDIPLGRIKIDEFMSAAHKVQEHLEILENFKESECLRLLREAAAIGAKVMAENTKENNYRTSSDIKGVIPLLEKVRTLALQESINPNDHEACFVLKE